MFNKCHVSFFIRPQENLHNFSNKNAENCMRKKSICGRNNFANENEFWLVMDNEILPSFFLSLIYDCDFCAE